MAIVREDLIPSLVENTTMQKVFRDGVFAQIAITPCEGYVLHDKKLDSERADLEALKFTEEISLGFCVSTKTVKYDYDFTENPREFYVVSETDLSENTKIF